jgi:hypothetical protein
MTRGSSGAPGRSGSDFTLPLGYTDAAGRVHQHGQMRLATALDEIEPLGDPRVKDNEAFLGLLLFSRVVVRLGDFSPVPLEVIAGLYAADFSYLQALYIEVNSLAGMNRSWAQFAAGAPQPGFGSGQLPEHAPALHGSIETVCPQCQAELILDLDAATGVA